MSPRSAGRQKDPYRKVQEETASRPWLQYGASLWVPTKKREASLSAVNRGTRPALETRGPTWTRELGAMSWYTDLGFLRGKVETESATFPL